jgi:1-acyl-sn-glycerol-3-phosphate acyltransferase
MGAPAQTLGGTRPLRDGGAVRAAARAILLAVATFVSYALLQAGRPPARAIKGSGDAWTQRVFSAWARVLLRILGVRLRVDGAPPIPPFFLVSNHLGYLDVLVFAAVARPVFISRSDVAGWPFVGRLVRGVGTIFVDRGLKRDLPRAAGDVEDRLRRGLGVILFAEGTSTDGSDVLPFRPSLLEPASRAGLPVHYASISYDTPPGAPPARLAVCWWGEMDFGPHLRGLLRVPRIEARVTFGSGPKASADRRVLAAELWQAVRRHHRPPSR